MTRLPYYIISSIIISFFCLAVGEEISIDDRIIYLQFEEVPTFDSLSGNILTNENLDTNIYNILYNYDCDSLTKRYIYRWNDNLSKWYQAFFTDQIDVIELGDTLIEIPSIENIDFDYIQDTIIAASFTIDDPDYDSLIDLFEMFGVDSALMLEQGDTSIITLIMCVGPFEWGHPDLINNVWVNPGEDYNENGTIEPWLSSLDSLGLPGDFDGVDNDGDGFIDNIIGKESSLSTMQQAQTNGADHETDAAGIISAESNNIGGLGVCPKCRIGTHGSYPIDLFIERMTSKGVKVFSVSWSYGMQGARIEQIIDELNDSGGVYIQCAMNDFVYRMPPGGRIDKIVNVGGFYLGMESYPDFTPMGRYHESIDFCLPASSYPYWTTKDQGTYARSGGGTSAATPFLAGMYALMLSYSLHHDSLNWTIDSITNRLIASSTPIETQYDGYNPTYGLMGVGYPNVYHAMTMSDYNIIELQNSQVTNYNYNKNFDRPITSGDTVNVIFEFRSRINDFDSLHISIASKDIILEEFNSEVVKQNITKDSLIHDTVSCIIPTNASLNEPIDLNIIIDDFVNIIDTLQVGSIILTKAPEFIISSYDMMDELFSTINPVFINVGNVDADESKEMVFYMKDSLYCVDLNLLAVEMNYPIAIDYNISNNFNSFNTAPAIGAINSDQTDCILYSASMSTIGLIINNDPNDDSSWVKGFGTYYTSPIFCDVNMDGSLEIIHITYDSLFILDIGGNNIQGSPTQLHGNTIRGTNIATGDLNNDGFPEIIVATSYGLEIYNILNDTAIYTATKYKIGTNSNYEIKIGDITGNGMLEVLIPTPNRDYLAHIDLIGCDSSGQISLIDSIIYTSNENNFLEKIKHFENYRLADIDSDYFPNIISLINDAHNPRIIAFDTSLNYYDLIDSLTFKGLYDPVAHREIRMSKDLSYLSVGYVNGDNELDLMFTSFKYGYFNLIDVNANYVFNSGNPIHINYKKYNKYFFNSTSAYYGYNFINSSPSIFSDGDKTWIALYDFIRLDTSLYASTNKLNLKLFEFDYDNPSQEWQTKRHDKYLTSCYRQPTLGTIDTNIVWRDTVYLYGDLVVSEGDTLTINPGTVIRSVSMDLKNQGDDSTRPELIVYGHLNVKGTSSRQVEFTSFSDEEGGWYGIVVDSTGSLNIEYATIKYAYTGIYDKGSEEDTIKNCLITDCEINGIKTSNDNLVILNSKIENISPGYGIYVDECEPTIVNDTIVACETGINLYKSKMTLRDLNIEGPGDNGVSVVSKPDTVLSNTTNLINLSITGSFLKHIYINSGNVKIDSCYLESPTDSSRSDYGIVANITSYATLRNTQILNYDAVGIYPQYCNLFEWDLGKDTTGEYGNNSIYTDDTTSYAIQGPSGGDLYAQRNWWGNDSPSSSLFSLLGSYVVIYQPYLTSNPFAKAFVENSGLEIPKRFELFQNYPNPFNPATTIKFDLPKATNVSLEIYNILGQKVVTLVDEPLTAGHYAITWDGKSRNARDVSSGVYFYRIKTEQNIKSKKMILVK